MTQQADAPARDLLSRAESAFGRQAVPVHVIRRLAALIGPEPAVHLDGDLSRDRFASQPIRSGMLVVLTATTVALAVLEKSPLDDLPDARGTVTVEMWGRQILTGLRLDVEENADSLWGQDWDGRWPRGAFLRLTYAGRPDPLRLPVGEGRDSGLENLMPGLTADLGPRA